VLSDYDLNKEVVRRFRETKQAVTCDYPPWCSC